MNKNALLKTTYALVLPSLFFREHINSKVILLNLILVIIFYGKKIFTRKFFTPLFQSLSFILLILLAIYISISNGWYGDWDTPEFHFALTWLGIGLLSYTFGHLHLIDWKKIRWYYTLTIIPVSLYVIGQYYTGADLYYVLHGHVFTSILLSGNIILVVSDRKNCSKLFQKTIGIISLVVSAYTLVILGARMCLAALAFILFLILFRKDYRKAFLFSPVLCLFFWGLYVGNENFHQRFNGFFTWNSHNPFFLRILQWKGYLLAFKENWLLGLGHSQTLAFVNHYYHKIHYAAAINSKYHAHNQYLELMAKYGVAGLFIFLSFILSLLRVAIHKKTKWYTLWILFFALLNLTENVALSRHVSAVFFSFILFSMLFTSRENDTQIAKKPNNNAPEL